uniref:uncharacterized protein n=1 Tax=Pristiophorus japonicus TaxID=55135 RepID=UPI00398EBF53
MANLLDNTDLADNRRINLAAHYLGLLINFKCFLYICCRFISLHKEVNSDCSLVLRMQTEGNNQAERLKKEMKVHQDCMKSLNEAKEKIKAEINHIQRELNDNKERQRLFNIEWTFANIPFFPFFSLSSAVHWPILNRFEILIERLQSQKLEKEKEFENLELKIIKEQMEYVSIQTKAGIAVSDAENLKSVEGHLFKAQLVLEKIINFWEQTEMTIKGIEQKTTASDVFLKDLKKYKVHFIKNLESVEEVWKKFSSYCLKCKSDYDRRSIDLYHFLAVNACHLSPEDLNKRITAANDKLLKLCETSRGESIGEAPSVPALPKNV